MCVGMYLGMCAELCAAMRTGMCAALCADMSEAMCAGMCTGERRHELVTCRIELHARVCADMYVETCGFERCVPLLVVGAPVRAWSFFSGTDRLNKKRRSQ